jgi:multimeric flavodoxin WrbA
MKATILNGAQEGDRTGTRVSAMLIQSLKSQGWEIDHIPVRDKKIGNCAGDFFCWIRSPGICNIKDDNRVIAEAIMKSNLLVYLTPIRFGGYGSTLKKAVDHQIQNISPFFKKINGETHHQKRYSQYPNFLAIGWMEAANDQEEIVFRHLAWRNALNFHAKKAATGVVLASQMDQEIKTTINNCFNNLQLVEQWKPNSLPQRLSHTLKPAAIQRAVLLVGSPRTRKSTSSALGNYLFEQLSAKNIETRTINIHTSLCSPTRSKDFLDAVNDADLIVLAFPLYVDSLPAPTIEAMERIIQSRNGRQTHQRFAAIANCGFPEADHNATALAICEMFSRHAGFQWAGSLSLGAGQGLVHGTPLDELGGRAITLKNALELAADALATGQPIPDEVQALWKKPFIPGWLYRAMGQYGWRQQAKKYGAEKMLKRRVYAN